MKRPGQKHFVISIGCGAIGVAAAARFLEERAAVVLADIN